MSYTIQIEPLTAITKMKTTETKRQSFYTRIRYASKLLRLRTEIRKHRTLPNDFVMIPSTNSAITKNYCYAQDNDEEVDAVTIFNEKDALITTTNKDYSLNCDSQLILPSKLKYFITDDDPIDEQQPSYLLHYSYKDEEDEDVVQKEKENIIMTTNAAAYDNDSEDEDAEDDLDNYMMETSTYTATLQKLSGISFANNNREKKNKAVLITLSPCALAAANAARQKRQKIRISSSSH